MRKTLVIAMTALALGACAGQSADTTTRNTLYDVENGYAIALTAASAYKANCAKQPATDPCYVTVVKMQGYDQRAYTLLVQARKDRAFVSAALSAVQEFKAVVGVK